MQLSFNSVQLRLIYINIKFSRMHTLRETLPESLAAELRDVAGFEVPPCMAEERPPTGNTPESGDGDTVGICEAL